MAYRLPAVDADIRNARLDADPATYSPVHDDPIEERTTTFGTFRGPEPGPGRPAVR